MSSPMEYKGDVTLALSVKDMDKAIAWYEEVLGFQVLYRLQDMKWCEMRAVAENITVGIGQSEEETPKGGCVPVWGVKDIAASRQWLESRDVRFDGPTREVAGMVKLATFYDPDGNCWMLAQSLQPQP